VFDTARVVKPVSVWRGIRSGPIRLAVTVAGRTSLKLSVLRLATPSPFGESTRLGRLRDDDAVVEDVDAVGDRTLSRPGSDGRLSSFPLKAIVVEPPESSAGSRDGSEADELLRRARTS
jgi:hypothetical protein